MINYLRRFIEVNRNICNKIENTISLNKPDFTELYSKLVAEYANKKKQPVIIDIGGGRLTPFVKYLNSALRYQLIVVDKNKKELEYNFSANKTITTDVNKELPIQPNTADIIVSRYVFEHLENLPGFILNSNKILKTDGYSIHLFSCKFAIFAILNQIFPHKLTKFLLSSLVPGSQYIRGFKTNYDHCYYSAIVDIFTKKGFSIDQIKISYYGSRYFSFFVPFFIISVIYEVILQSIGIKNLGSYILIVAKKDRD